MTLPSPTTTQEMYLQAMLAQMQAMTAAVKELTVAVTAPVEAPKTGVVEATEPVLDDFTALKGIGPKRREELYAKGIFSFRDLAMADNDWLATTMEVSPATLHEWQQRAMELAL